MDALLSRTSPGSGGMCQSVVATVPKKTLKPSRIPKLSDVRMCKAKVEYESQGTAKNIQDSARFPNSKIPRPRLKNVFTLRSAQRQQMRSASKTSLIIEKPDANKLHEGPAPVVHELKTSSTSPSSQYKSFINKTFLAFQNNLEKSGSHCPNI